MLKALTRVSSNSKKLFFRTNFKQFSVSVEQSSALMQQHRLVPVTEHPLFPGSSQAVQLSQEQYEILKEDEDKYVFASVVKNDEILRRRGSSIIDMLNPRKSGQEPLYDLTLPQIKDLSDVYETGCICVPKLIHDSQNHFMPYVLNLFPI